MTYIWYRGSIKIWEEKLWCLSFNGAYVKVGGRLRVKYGGIWMGSDWWDNLYLITKTIWDNLNSRNIIIMGQKCTRVQDTDQNFQLWSVAMANPNRGRTIWDFSKFCTDRTFLVHLFFFESKVHFVSGTMRECRGLWTEFHEDGRYLWLVKAVPSHHDVMSTWSHTHIDSLFPFLGWIFFWGHNKCWIICFLL